MYRIKLVIFVAELCYEIDNINSRIMLKRETSVSAFRRFIIGQFLSLLICYFVTRALNGYLSHIVCSVIVAHKLTAVKRDVTSRRSRLTAQLQRCWSVVYSHAISTFLVADARYSCALAST